MLISFSPTDFFTYKEGITAVPSSGVVGVKEKEFLIVTSLCIVKLPKE